MTDARKSRAKKNIVVSLLNQIVGLLCGLVVPRALLGAFGSEVYGACSSITQFLSYIALLEGGIGGVARAALYKPIANNDGEAISAILSEIQRFFRIILYVFAGYVLVIACSFQKISHVESLDYMTTFLLVMVISLSTFAQYYIGIANSTLLTASQRGYIVSGTNLLTTLLNAVAVVILTARGCSILTVKLVSSLIYIVKPLVFWLCVRRIWHPVQGKRGDKTYLTQKWSGLSQHIAYFLHSNTDVVILTFFANLKFVAVYSVYNMVVTHIQNLTVAFTSGMEAVFGDMLAKEEHSQLHKTFDTYETITSLVSVTLFAVTQVMIVSFVKLYTSGISDADYAAPTFALLLVLATLLYCLRMPYHAVVMAAGHFKQTQLAAYGEAGINVVLSILLVNSMGLVGVAIGTVVATLFRLLYYVGYLSKHIFNRDVRLFVKRFLVNALAFILSCLTGQMLASRFSIDNYGTWALCGAGCTLLTVAVVLGMNLLFYHENCVRLLKSGLTRLRRKSK